MVVCRCIFLEDCEGSVRDLAEMHGIYGGTGYCRTGVRVGTCGTGVGQWDFAGSVERMIDYDRYGFLFGVWHFLCYIY